MFVPGLERTRYLIVVCSISCHGDIVINKILASPLSSSKCLLCSVLDVEEAVLVHVDLVEVLHRHAQGDQSAAGGEQEEGVGLVQRQPVPDYCGQLGN